MFNRIYYFRYDKQIFDGFPRTKGTREISNKNPSFICYLSHSKKMMNLSVENSSSLRHMIEPEAFCQRIQNDLSDKIRLNTAFIISALNLPLWIFILSGNSVILLALNRDTSLHPPSKLLFRNLAFTDLCVALITQPSYILHNMVIAYERWDICPLTQKLSHITTYLLCGVSLMTVCAISVDRLLALLMGTRYRQVVTLTRVRISLLFVWIFCLSTSITLLLNFSVRIYSVISAICIALWLGTSTFCYAKIFFILRGHQKKICGNRDQDSNKNRSSVTRSSINLKQYRRSVSTALWINFTLITCYSPTAIVLVFRSVPSIPFSALIVSFGAAPSFVYLNSLLNPILYCWRIKELREEVKKIISPP